MKVSSWREIAESELVSAAPGIDPIVEIPASQVIAILNVVDWAAVSQATRDGFYDGSVTAAEMHLRDALAKLPGDADDAA